MGKLEFDIDMAERGWPAESDKEVPSLDDARAAFIVAAFNLLNAQARTDKLKMPAHLHQALVECTIGDDSFRFDLLADSDRSHLTCSDPVEDDDPGEESDAPEEDDPPGEPDGDMRLSGWARGMKN